MQTEEEILAKVSSVMVELFELNADDIQLEAQLYEDLDIDSIDAVDLIVELKPYIGKKISPDEFKSVRTIQDVVNAVSQLINE